MHGTVFYSKMLILLKNYFVQLYSVLTVNISYVYNIINQNSHNLTKIKKLKKKKEHHMVDEPFCESKHNIYHFI